MHKKKLSSVFEPRLLLRAVEFAAEKHRDQRRKDVEASPYVNHPINVASTIAHIAEVAEPQVLIAAILHDTIEDTCTTQDELEMLFGKGVLNIVLEVTDDKSLPKLERKRLQVKHAKHMSFSAKLIKLADKCANIRDVTDNPPSSWPIKRRIEYLDWAEEVVAGCRGVNEALEAHFDEILKSARERLQIV